MKNNNESKPVTRAHLFARIDATLLSQPSRPSAEKVPPKVQDKERAAEDDKAK
ncbi:hypothetical protein [Achromobacter xylosoxidans]|uniref:hypothetical protein n=1 Tax=Alcaligenes xylosoxydans xylosoxydans TaxID=85698 RepID=UPI0038FD0661